ncbi:ABC transporter permease subunit [Stappia sp. ES.058]|uniref:ABC transporter permease subunit n=1 Tax=Stappia sp. ES.058 TaxID=1881061 RepID=UPI00087D58AB|nr:ABC transporter permease subunit [Stappia sp. ES.058]SDT95756.1 oligopeptide transport system permease protein [Stappia sp. ES.058]
MTVAVTQSRPVEGRSLWQDGLARLRRNRAAMASLVFLVLMALMCLIGPYLTGHGYDQVYRSYVKVGPSLAPYPKADAIAPAARDALKRARVDVGEPIEIVGESVRIPVFSSRDLDPRIVRYVDRVDIFSGARLEEVAGDGRTGVIVADIERFTFLFGTDATGRDLFTRTLIAGRISLTIGLLATVVAIVIGVTYGAVSGYLGGRVDLVMMRVVDVLYSLPFIFFVILLVVFFGRNFVLMFIAVGAVEWLDMARIVRGQTLSLKRQEFIQAAEALGVENTGILRRHIIPNLTGPVVIYMTLLVPRVILLESFLSFLGLGVQEPMTSWGVLISEGARDIEGNPTMLLFPAIFLTTTLFALNFIGDGLRDALDPKDR